LLVSAVTIQIDAAANRHAISPLIYGTAFATTAQLLDLNAPVNRSGGNTTTTYNWQQNASNHANDWYFESISDGQATPGESGDTFIQTSKNGNAQAALTIPIIDWVAKVAPDRSILPSFRVSKYGAQQAIDPFLADAGNGVLANGTNVTGNDPNDANVPNSTTLQQGWVQHLIGKWGNSSAGGLKYYLLDNEHSIWFSTHRDIAPAGATMDDLFGKMRDYSAMIKSQDSNAVVLGPEEWGWSGYFYSGFDQQYGAAHGWWSLPDRAAHANMDYMPWLLQQFKNYDTANGKRLLDIFTLHYYPQGGEFGDDVSAAMQARRNRSTRSLWDPNYVDETWINDKIKLIPRMKAWVAQYYPNTKIGVTEYNWGAEGNINGATTQADVYGIFGREGLDIATRWTTPATNSPVYNAMKMYRNYDGNKSGFGDISVSATVPNPDSLSAYASVRSIDGALTIMVINKVTSSQAATISLANFAAGSTAQVWQLTSANSITHLADTAVASAAINITVPAQSITLLIVAPNVVASPTNLIGTRFGSAISLNWT
ncbi:MAG: glycoside hydrolase family 44 protein, partial [Pyrinomonadaceae bacterium]